jgi:hypothetical protein
LKVTHEAVCFLWQQKPHHPAGKHIDSVIDKLRQGAIASCPVHHCDHNHETYEEVRLLPYGTQGGNMILCRVHYEVEIKTRQDANARFPLNDQIPTPEWEDLEVYEAG